MMVCVYVRPVICGGLCLRLVNDICGLCLRLVSDMCWFVSMLGQ